MEGCQGGRCQGGKVATWQGELDKTHTKKISQYHSIHIMSCVLALFVHGSVSIKRAVPSLE